MKQSNNRALKAGIWYTISNFFVKGLGFITMPLFTRLMTSSDVGMFSNITAWFSILAIITTFELYSSVNLARFDYKENMNEYISSTLVLGSIITAIFYFIVLLFKDFFLDLFLIDFQTLNILFIYLLVYPALQMFQLKKRIDYEYKSTIIVTILNALLSTGLSLILVILCSNKLMGRTIGYFVPLIITSLILYIYLLGKGKKIISLSYWKYALIIAFPLIWHLLAGYLLSSADKIMITKMISSEANAFYSVAYSLSSIANILWMSMNNAWAPWAYEQMDKKEYQNLKNNSKPYFRFFVIVVYLMMLLTPELLLIMGGNSYLEAKYVMPPVMTGYIFQFVYSLYVNIEFYHKKQKNIAIGTIIAATINIGLNYIFIKLFGYIAAAYTTLVGYICLFLIHYMFVKKLKCTSWYDTSFFVKELVISIGFMLLCNILYTINIVRYLFIAVLVVVICYIIVKNKSELKDAIKSKSLEKIFTIFRKGRKI